MVYDTVQRAGSASSHHEDVHFWAQRTGDDLETLMRHAEYPENARIRGLDFNTRHVAPFLGPRPNGAPPHWRSFMTEDYTPVEYSWAWNARPKVRYSFEPIASQKALRSDPFNREQSLKCAKFLHNALPKSEWTLFDSFARDFHSDQPRKRIKLDSSSLETSSPSSLFLALELGQDEPVTGAKAYAIPVRAEQTGESRQDVLRNCIDNLEGSSAGLLYPAWATWEQYVNVRAQSSPIQVLGIAIDCVEPTLSRLKIYFRTQETSFDSVRSVLSMGGSHTEWSERNLTDLKELWRLVLALNDTFPDSRELTENSCETSGLLYNFCFRHKSSDVETKIYIPVKHYGVNDKSIMEGLAQFLRETGRGRYADAFQEALREMCSYRKLEDGCGLQTYISVGLKMGELDLTSYLSPEVYHPGRIDA